MNQEEMRKLKDLTGQKQMASQMFNDVPLLLDSVYYESIPDHRHR